MPFWQAVQRCFNCKNWKADDPSSIEGICQPPVPPRRPFWNQDDVPPMYQTKHDDGALCPGYVHQRDKPHPLDRATAVLIRLRPGDKVTIRSFAPGRGLIDRAQADVLRITSSHVVVTAFNAEYRIRIVASVRERPGTVVNLDGWGLDPDAPVQRATARLERMQEAELRLAKVKSGDKVPLLGYPPFEGQTKEAHVLATRGKLIRMRCGHGPVLNMHRKGPLAGLIENDPLWVLDTRDA